MSTFLLFSVTRRELKHEFEIYMKQSAIKFLHRNRYMLDNEYIQNATAQ